jgi:hypothetical protein
VLEHAAVLGAATGMRSTVALAALIFRRSDGLPAVLRHPAARWIAALARRLPDPVVAVAEDALAIGLAAIGSG